MKLEDEVRVREITESCSPSLHEKWQAMSKACFYLWVDAYNRCAEAGLGLDKVNQIIVDTFSGTKEGDFMTAQVKELTDRLNITEKDATAVAKHFAYVGSMVGMDFHFLECNPKRVTMKITHCPEVGWLKELGLFGKIDWNGECTVAYCPTLAKLYNPKLEYIDGKAQCRGDDCCEKTWELKD